MTTINNNLGSGANADISLNSIYTLLQGRTAFINSLTFTNTTSNIITVSVYVFDGVDRLLQTVKIPAGEGKGVSVPLMRGVTLSANQIIKIQAASADSFNYKINGAERV